MKTSLNFAALAALSLCAVLPAVKASALAVAPTLTWNWSFNNGTEAGTFLTNSLSAGSVAPSGTYYISDFKVSASAAQPLDIGHSVGDRTFTIVNPRVGFIWDGSAPTEFFNNNTPSTAATAQFLDTPISRPLSVGTPAGDQYEWGFTVDGPVGQVGKVPSTGNFSPLTLNPAAATPEPGSVALLVSLGLTGAAFLRRRRQARKAV